MNDKDKKEFDKWFKNNWQDSDDKDVFTEAWQAACQFKQTEIDELEKEKDYLCQKMENIRTIYKNSEKLQAENAKLRDCVIFYADEDGQVWAACQDTDTKDTCCHMVGELSGGKRARQVLKELDEIK